MSNKIYNILKWLALIALPAESVEAYKAATNWSVLASRIQAIPA